MSEPDRPLAREASVPAISARECNALFTAAELGKPGTISGSSTATFRGLRGEPLRIRLSPKRAPLHGSERYVSEAVAATLAATDCCPQLGPCQVGHVSISLITFRPTAEPSASCRAHRPIACFSGLPSGRLEHVVDRIGLRGSRAIVRHRIRQDNVLRMLVLRPAVDLSWV